MILASSFISFLVYLVIIVIWVIGQVVQQREAKRKAEEMKRKREERERNGEPVDPRRKTVEDELQEFLGKLTGTPPAAPAPVPREAPKPKPAGPIQFDKPYVPPTPPTPPPAKTRSAPAVASAALRKEAAIRDIDDSDVYNTVQDIKDVVDLEFDNLQSGESGLEVEALMNVRTLMVDLSNVNLPIMRVPIPNSRPVRTKTSKPRLHKRKALKQAVVGGILLGPPKALTPDPFGSEVGEL